MTLIIQVKFRAPSRHEAFSAPVPKKVMGTKTKESQHDFTGAEAKESHNIDPGAKAKVGKRR